MEQARNTGILYVVGTPIGNLGDLSPRVIDTFKTCDLIACEDTRVSSRLLNHAGIHKPLISYRDDNEIRCAELLLEKLLQGETIALISDAGVPTISDPGFRITRLCHKNKVPVIPIPGPSAVITALSCSGLPTDSFLFLGFLLPKKSARIKTFTDYFNFPHTLLFYESPHRIEKCLNDMMEVYGETRCVTVAKELTKMHERVITGNLVEVQKEVMGRSLKGEFVIAVAPASFEL
jgi:16S rRNA (cytidine1402-2'-O)-methyltransferase